MNQVVYYGRCIQAACGRATINYAAVAKCIGMYTAGGAPEYEAGPLPNGVFEGLSEDDRRQYILQVAADVHESHHFHCLLLGPAGEAAYTLYVAPMAEFGRVLETIYGRIPRGQDLAGQSWELRHTCRLAGLPGRTPKCQGVCLLFVHRGRGAALRGVLWASFSAAAPASARRQCIGPGEPRLQVRLGAVRIVHKLITWLAFSVAVALLPIAFHSYQLAARGRPCGLGATLQNGELLLVSVAIGATAVGEVVRNRRAALSAPKMLAAGICMLLLLFSSLCYADITSAHLSGDRIMHALVVQTSVICYAATLVCSGCCIALAEIE